MDIIKELMVFNHIKYYDEPHIYYINGEKTISCTGLIHKFTTDFEAGINKPDKWAEKQGHFYTPTSMADKYAHKQNYYPMDGDPYDRPDYDKPKPVEEWVKEEVSSFIDDYVETGDYHDVFDSEITHNLHEPINETRIIIKNILKEYKK